MRVRHFAVGAAAALGLAACGGQQAAQPTSLPSAATQASPTAPSASALTVDKAGFTMTGDGQAVWGALITNHDAKNIAMRVDAAITFSDAKGTALGTATSVAAGPIMPGHTVAVSGESASDVIPKGTTPVKATGKAQAAWQPLPRYLSQGKVALSDLKVNFEQGLNIDRQPDSTYNKTTVMVTATSSFGNTWKSNAAAVCMDASGNIVSGGSAHEVDLVPNTPTIIQALDVPGPQPATCVMSVEPRLQGS